MSVTFRGHEDIWLAADVAGPADGAAVLLLHGGGQTRHAWHRVSDALAKADFLAVSLDLRGHGDSGWSTAGEYGLEAYAEDLRRVSHQLDRPVSLIGASLGGLAAMLAAGEEPRVDCSALVLVDVTPRLSRAGRQNVLSFMRSHAEGFASVQQAADAVAEYLPHRPRPRDASGLRRNLREGPDGRLFWHWDPRFLDSRRGESDDAPPDRLERAVRSVTAPILLVRGAMSDLVTAEHAAEFRRVVPDAEYVDVPGAGHMVAGDSNDVFGESVVEFLQRRAGGRRSTGADTCTESSQSSNMN